MLMRISSTIKIKATPAKVFTWLEDPERAMKWQTSVTKYKIIKDTLDKVGTTFIIIPFYFNKIFFLVVEKSLLHQHFNFPNIIRQSAA